jgi:hypothetical protein
MLGSDVCSDKVAFMFSLFNGLMRSCVKIYD